MITKLMAAFLPRTFNDVLALGILFFVIPGLWVLDARSMVKLDTHVTGALITTWNTLLIFYLRKAPPGNGGPPNEVTPPAPNP